jgi:alkanesulfonate monooxygenase SsuD/methylene tetrahydromethanopterin reductase-like flavin-dependent oxidoreductase (luciferase family)
VADLVFSFARSQAEALELAQDVRERATAYGRDADRILFVPALGVTIADSDEEAHALEARRLGLGDPQAMLGMLSRQFGGFDFSGYDLDAPFPDIPPPREAAGISRFHEEIAAVRRDGGTLREVLARQRTSWLRLVGSPATIAREIAAYYHSGAADGFNLFVQHPADWARFRIEVVPLLVEQGLFRSDYEAATLRGNLGLPIPDNIHSTCSVSNEIGALQFTV